MRRSVATLLTSVALAACGSPDGETRRFGPSKDATFPARRGTVLAEGCALDGGQRATLADQATKRVVREVVLMCLSVSEGGGVSPSDPGERAAVLATIAYVRAEGYRASLGLVLGDAWSAPYPSERSAKLLADPASRQATTDALGTWITEIDGLDVALWPLPWRSRDDATAFVTAIANLVRPAISLAVHVPPSTTTPSDLPGGDAFDVASLSQVTDRVRVTTLDYSTVDSPGPTVDPGWAVDAVRRAASFDARAALDVSLPLYGWDFARGAATSVTASEANAVCASHRASVTRGASGAPRCAFDDGGTHHDVFFDDTSSLTLDLAAWEEKTLSRDVGVLFWGLGAEDPTLFRAIAAGQR